MDNLKRAREVLTEAVESGGDEAIVTIALVSAVFDLIAAVEAMKHRQPPD